MNSTDTLNNELNDTLGYLIDKFNITLELSSNQIKDFSEQFARKIITWEILWSSLNIILSLSIILVVIGVFKKMKLDKLKEIWKNATSTDNNAVLQNSFGVKLVIKLVGYVIIIGSTISILSEAVDIIMSLTFPEKIILEFISKYF